MSNKIEVSIVLDEIKTTLKNLFGEDLWIPRAGVSKSGNIYITLILKNPFVNGEILNSSLRRSHSYPSGLQNSPEGTLPQAEVEKDA